MDYSDSPQLNDFKRHFLGHVSTIFRLRSWAWDFSPIAMHMASERLFWMNALD